MNPCLVPRVTHVRKLEITNCDLKIVSSGGNKSGPDHGDETIEKKIVNTPCAQCRREPIREFEVANCDLKIVGSIGNKTTWIMAMKPSKKDCERSECTMSERNLSANLKCHFGTAKSSLLGSNPRDETPNVKRHHRYRRCRFYFVGCNAFHFRMHFTWK